MVVISAQSVRTANLNKTEAASVLGQKLEIEAEWPNLHESYRQAHNIRVNCIAPGLIRTDFARALWEDEVLLAKRTATTPLRRIGEPDEIAGAAVFLASRAGSFMTGQSLVVDGGVTI